MSMLLFPRSLLVLIFLFYYSLFKSYAVKRERQTSFLGISFKQSSGLNDSLPLLLAKDEYKTGQSYEKDYEIELLVIADHSMFEAFLDLYKDDDFAAFQSLTDYLKGLFEQTKTIFDRFVFFEKDRLHLKLSRAMVISRSHDCPLKSILMNSENETDYEDFKDTNLNFSLQIEALEAIHLLEDWIWEHAEFLPVHDHAVFITKFDLLSSKNESSTQGMAYVKAMCRDGESTSIIEDVGGLTTSAIIAHELAHSLGAHHDGFGEAAACASDQNFLMASSSSGNEFSSKFANNFLLSRCSTKQIEDFLSSPESQCLWKKQPKEKARLFHRSSGAIQQREKKPGELFDRNRQCMIAFGPHYGFCTDRAYYHKRGDPCRRLWCKNRKQKKFAPCETKSYLPLMDGTKCDDGKWCISGTCVANEFALYDKRDCEDVNKAYCQKQGAFKLKLFCRKKSFKEICCELCERVLPSFKKDFIS